jgi:hypothetical protein
MSAYPTGYDAFTNPAGSDPLNTSGAKLHSTQHGQANDAIEAIEAELGLSPSGSEATVADRLTAIEATIGGGINLIDSGTFSAASEFHVDLFSSTYDDYLLITVLEGSVASEKLRARLRASSTDNTSATYGWAEARNFTNLTQDDKQATDSSWWVGRTGAASGKRHVTRMEIFGPNEATTTGFVSHSAGHHSSSTTGILDYIGGDFNNTTVFTGIKVYPASGTITGRYALYGYAK